MPPVDPNFLTNAFASGAELGYRFGPQAQEDRASVIAARSAQTDFLYGNQAREDRQSVINARDEATDFNYGQGAETYRETQRQGIEAQTQFQSLLNVAQRLTNVKLQADEDTFGKLQRQLTAANTEGNLVGAQRALEFIKGPVAAMANQQLLSLNLQKTVSDAQFEFDRSQVDNEAGIAQAKVGSANASKQLLEATRSRQEAEEDANFVDTLKNAREADYRVGSNYHQNLIDVLEAATTSKYGALSRNADLIQSDISRLRDAGMLSPELAQRLEPISQTLNYERATRNLQGTIGQARAAREQGPLDEREDAVYNAFVSTGYDENDPSTGKDVEIETLSDGSIRFKNNSTGELSWTLTPAQYRGSKLYHKISQSLITKRNNLGNPKTTREEVVSKLKKMESRPLNGVFTEAFSTLTENMPVEFKNELAVMEAGEVFADMQDNINLRNPLFKKEFLELEEGDIFSGGLLAGFSENAGKAEKIKQKLELNSGYKKQIQDAWLYRETGGLPPAVFNDYLNRLVEIAAKRNPGLYGPQVDRRVREQNRDALRTSIRANLNLPRLTNLPESIKVAAGLTDIQDESSRGYLSSTLLGIRQFIGGEGITDYIERRPVADTVMSPTVLPSTEE